MSKRKLVQAAQDALEEGEASDDEEDVEDPGQDGVAKDNALLSDEDPSSDEDGTPLQHTPPGESAVRLPLDAHERSGSSNVGWKP